MGEGESKQEQPNTRAALAPTSLFSPPWTSLAGPSDPTGELALPADFPMRLTPEQVEQVKGELVGRSLAGTSLLDIAKLGSEAEVALHRTLGGFLDRIEKGEQPKIFTLISRLGEAVDDQRLPALADEILNAKPTMMERLAGMFSKKALAKAMQRAFEEIRLRAAGKTKTLNDVLKAMETELADEQRRLEGELRTQEQLKESYREHFRQFGVVVAFMLAWLAQSREEVQRAAAQGADATELRALNEKLQALESRTLALEGTLTRLPADQMTVRMLENAGIATLQETMTTASSRFASIKMTLLTIHGTLVTQGVQRLAEQGAALDANLLAVRSALMKDVVDKAANAPGDNRLAQAEGLKKIVADTRELVAIVDRAAENNQKKFQAAREISAQARRDLAELGAAIRPDLPLNR
jgi:PAS domain-containing protein